MNRWRVLVVNAQCPPFINLCAEKGSRRWQFQQSGETGFEGFNMAHIDRKGILDYQDRMKLARRHDAEWINTLFK